MNDCLELIYDRFGIDFYPLAGVQFKKPMMIHEKFVSSSDITIIPSELYLSVGNFPEHTGKQIKANDTQDNITTTVSERKDNEQYTVNIHFEFKNPTAMSVSLCEAMDVQPFHIILNQYALTGGIGSRRVIRNGEGQSRVEVSEEEGAIKIDITIQNVNGIQLIG